MIASWLTIVVLVTDAVLRVVLAIHVVYRRRPVAVTLAWLVVIAFIPIFAVAAYLLVGESRLGRRRLARYEALTKGLERQAMAMWKHRDLEAAGGDYDHAQISRYGTAVSGFPPLRGNRLTLIGDNDTMLESLIRDIDGARNHVHMLFYIWTEDLGATRVSEALIRAAERGVECRVLVDGVGSWKFIGGPLWDRMREKGVRLVEALPVNWFRRPLARVDLRNHRKIAVFDGRVGYCGSQNINDNTFRSRHWRHTGPWIDASVRVEGPAAQALAVTFLRDWLLDSQETIADAGRYLRELAIDADAESLVQVIPSGPGPTPQAIHQALLTMIYLAREELLMTTPYFVPDDALLAALVAASSRGVRVTIVMPKVSDSPLVAAASRSYYEDLLEAGVQLWHYTGGLLHAKTVTVDRRMGVIGSANMDARSFFLNFEATLIVYDANFASSLRFLQTGYFNQSHEVLREAWKRRPRAAVLRDNCAQLLGPLL